jgi:hypothetical protein
MASHRSTKIWESAFAGQEESDVKMLLFIYTTAGGKGVYVEPVISSCLLSVEYLDKKRTVTSWVILFKSILPGTYVEEAAKMAARTLERSEPMVLMTPGKLKARSSTRMRTKVLMSYVQSSGSWMRWTKRQSRLF